jgi:hypothetical protein
MLRKLAAGLVFLAGVSFVLMMDAESIRYANMGNSRACSVRQLQTLPTDAEVFILGSSRMRRGVDPSVWAAESGGVYQSVFNLGRPGEDILRSEAILNDLLDAGYAPKAIVLEADVDPLRSGLRRKWSWSKQLPGVLTWKGIYDLSGLIRPEGGYARLRLFLEGAQKKMAQATSLVTSGVVLDTVMTRNREPVVVCWKRDFDVPNELKTKRQSSSLKEMQDRFGDVQTAFDHKFEAPVGQRSTIELAAVRRITAKAESAGIQIIVVRPQAYAQPPLAPEVLAQLVELIPQFRYPPEDLARRLSTLQIDNHHFGPEGRALYTRWLIDTLLADGSGS